MRPEGVIGIQVVGDGMPRGGVLQDEIFPAARRFDPDACPLTLDLDVLFLHCSGWKPSLLRRLKIPGLLHR